MIRRRGQDTEEGPSSDEEDAFAALSRQNSAKRSRVENRNALLFECAKKSVSGSMKSIEDLAEKLPALSSTNASSDDFNTAKLPAAVTSSMKRHHKPSDTRKAKMDALLLELQEEKGKQKNLDPRQFVPEKKGSFVGPGEEKLTSNLFVGNLAPSITEEHLSNLFSQFGDLYSIKIMWPRTMEERQRGRNTGFVCFMNREDAEEALESCNETDPFNVGRLVTMGWGKNVKRNTRQESGDFADTNSLHMNTQQNEAKSMVDDVSQPLPQSRFMNLSQRVRSDGLPSVTTLGSQLQDRSLSDTYEEIRHSSGAIRVEAPTDPTRFHLISVVASYVARDGMAVERRLCSEEEDIARFNFLTLDNADEQQRKEYLFYRWRVYSFAQGDTYSSWRTDPFVMFHPNGRYWIPPPVNKLAATREKEVMRKGKERQRQEMENRTKAREIATGRQLERARLFRRRGRGQRGDNPSMLDSNELDEFNRLVQNELSLSRERICRAMAFCFEKCLAAEQISGLLRDALLDDSTAVTIDMRIARLFLLSDVLFNSQQPGIRNAFMYRTSIESMAPDIFSVLGKYREGNNGRMTINKLRKAVSAVLGAWTDWGVYNAAFMDELESHFEGRGERHEFVSHDKNPPINPIIPENILFANADEDEGESMHVRDFDSATIPPGIEACTSHHNQASPRNTDQIMPPQQGDANASSLHLVGDSNTDLDGEPIGTDLNDLDGEDIDAEIDGLEYDDEECTENPIDPKSMEEDLDGESLNDEVSHG
jgi:U2-associated protein SR140